MKGPGINLLDRLATLRPGRLGVVLLAALAAILLDSSVSAQTVIEIDRFGAGNAYRPGGPVAVRVIITSDQDEPVPGLIQWETSNPDGDIAANIRRIAVPGRGGVATTWVIADLPSRSDATAVTIEPWIFRLFEYRDGRRIREIASARIDPSLTQPRAAQQTEELAMVIGPNTAGLDGYGPIAGFNHRPGLNEQMVVVPNVSPGDLPDEWAGLAQYGLIVWAANDPTFYPSIIGNKPSIENALRRWIERGGHLVILLPGGSDPWRLGRNEMAFGDLLGELEPIKETGVPLIDALPALSDRSRLRRPDARFDLHRFEVDDLPSAWRPLAGFRPYWAPFDPDSIPVPDDAPPAARQLLVDDGQRAWEASKPPPVIYAVRRDVGHGTLDVVGIDVADPDLRVQQAPMLPATSTFWNPILGRRAFTANPPALAQLKNDRRLVPPGITDDIGNGTLVSPVISLSGAAATGLLVGVMLFASYWLLAGPLGYAMLKRGGLQRHAWTAFALSGLGFAILAWILGRISIGQSAPMKHLTVLRHVYSPSDEASAPSLDRAISWFSSQLSGYGLASVEIGEDDSNDLLSHFSPPPNGLERTFLDANRYDVPFESRNGHEVPARATSAEFFADWMGASRSPSQIWSSTIRVDPDDPIRVFRTLDGRLEIDGTLINASGILLSNILISITDSQRTTTLPLGVDGLPSLGSDAAITDVPPNLGLLFARAKPWREGEAWDLGTAFPRSQILRSIGPNSLGGELADLFQVNETLADIAVGRNLSEGEREKNLQGLSLFGMLTPPQIKTNQDSRAGGSQFQRRLARSIDLSRRLVEPNLVIMAFAYDAPCPVPITINGELQAGEGIVMLQWIHPLPVDVDLMVPERDEQFDPKSIDGGIDDLDPKDGVAAAWR